MILRVARLFAYRDALILCGCKVLQVLLNAAQLAQLIPQAIRRKLHLFLSDQCGDYGSKVEPVMTVSE